MPDRVFLGVLFSSFPSIPLLIRGGEGDGEVNFRENSYVQLAALQWPKESSWPELLV